MRVDVIFLLAYIIGVLITYRWMIRLLTEDPKYASNPSNGVIAAALTAFLWPLAVPSHVIFLIRTREKRKKS